MKNPDFENTGFVSPTWLRLRRHIIAIVILVAAAAFLGKIFRMEKASENRARAALHIAADEELRFRLNYGRFGDTTEILAARRARLKASPATVTPPVFVYTGETGTIREETTHSRPLVADNPFARIAPEGWNWREISVGRSSFELRLEEEWSLPWTENCFSINETGNIFACENFTENEIRLGN